VLLALRAAAETDRALDDRATVRPSTAEWSY
jgi:hypothetical protein